MNQQNLERLRRDIAVFLNRYCAEGFEQEAADCRADGNYRQARIFERVAKGLRDEMQKRRIEEAGDYNALLTPTAPWGKRAYDSTGLESAVRGDSVSKCEDTPKTGRGYDDLGL
jgi:hypothetical protein